MSDNESSSFKKVKRLPKKHLPLYERERECKEEILATATRVALQTQRLFNSADRQGLRMTQEQKNKEACIDKTEWFDFMEGRIREMARVYVLPYHQVVLFYGEVIVVALLYETERIQREGNRLERSIVQSISKMSGA